MRTNKLTGPKRLAVGGLQVVAGVFVGLVAVLVGLVTWYWMNPPRAHYTLLVYNEGRVPIVGGYLAGDSLWRPVGDVRLGRARAFTFWDIPDRDDLDYSLNLVRSDSSRVAVRIGWIDGVWAFGTLEHFVAEIPSDSSRSVGVVQDLDRQTKLERGLKARGLIDLGEPEPKP